MGKKAPKHLYARLLMVKKPPKHLYARLLMGKKPPKHLYARLLMGKKPPKHQRAIAVCGIFKRAFGISPLSLCGKTDYCNFKEPKQEVMLLNFEDCLSTQADNYHAATHAAS
jgi:hypothetical protein